MTGNGGLRFYIYRPGPGGPADIPACDFAARAKERIFCLLGEKFREHARGFAERLNALSEADRGRAAYGFLTDPAALFSRFAVMSPQKNGLLGVGELNVFLRDSLASYCDSFAETIPGTGDAALRSAFCRAAAAAEKKKHVFLDFIPDGYEKWTLRYGDRLMCAKNDYANGIYNGECGTVADIDHISGTFRVRYPGRRHICTYTAAESGIKNAVPAREYLIPAYAMTIHKAQGSEYDSVCLVLSSEHRGSLSRNLLYTGISRARSSLYIITDTHTWNMAMEKDGCADECRYPDTLADLLRKKAHGLNKDTDGSRA